MADCSSVIRAEGLVKRFPAPGGGILEALSGVTLSIPRGRIAALVGADAAGKTTFLRLVAGLLEAEGGELEVLGLDAARRREEIQSRISYMPQRFGLYEDLSVRENMDLYADLHGVPEAARPARYRKLLAMAGLSPFTERLAGKLSGGMKQKLGLICTLVRTPELLLLDEPSVGVDPLSRRDLWEIVEALVDKEGITVLWATSYMDEAQKADSVFAIHGGRLLASGAPRELTSRASGRTFMASPAAGVPARRVQAALFDRPDLVADAVPEGGGVRFILAGGVSLESVSQAFPGLEISRREPDFEDAFMMMISQASPARRPQAVEAPALLSAGEAPAFRAPEVQPVIRARHLVRRFGDFTAVADTSFEVARGEIFGLLGPNGAGKTTTFRMLCGLLPATSGELEVAGYDLRRARAEARGSIGYVAQKFSLYRDLTPRENLEFFGGAYGLAGARLRSRVDAVLSEFGLDSPAPSGSLPEGFKRRLSLAAALIHEPSILFLDEPTSGIDPMARRSFWRTVTRLSGSGVTVIVTTHFMEEAEYCDRIAIQDEGRFLALGTPGEVRRGAGASCRSMGEAFIAIVEKSRSRAAGGAS